MALRLPFQCRSWNTVISSWNSSIVRPRLDWSINLNAPIPVDGFSASSRVPYNHKSVRWWTVRDDFNPLDSAIFEQEETITSTQWAQNLIVSFPIGRYMWFVAEFVQNKNFKNRIVMYEPKVKNHWTNWLDKIKNQFIDPWPWCMLGYSRKQGFNQDFRTRDFVP